MSTIAINGNTLDPQVTTPAENASGSNYILVQTAAPVKKAEKEALQGLNVCIKEKVSESTYLCRYEPSDLSKIRDLDFVKFVDVYADHFVVSAKLKSEDLQGTQAVLSDSERTKTVDVVFHEEHGKSAQTLIAAVAKAAHVDVSEISGRRDKVRLDVEPRYLEAVAKIDEVQSIEEVLPNRLMNNIARGILAADDVPFGNSPLRGAGQVVAVADTGVDSDHQAFTDRIKKTYALGRPGLSDDPQGHGTHVCGSVLGKGTTNQGLLIQGTAPEALLVMQSVGDSMRPPGLRGIPRHLDKLFFPPYDADGARVHSNSWGPGPGQPYNQNAGEIDKFVCDHPDMVICFAAGNDGVDWNPEDGVTDTKAIGAQAAAKNLITVGASENFRPDEGLTYGDPIFTDRDTGQIKFGMDPIASDTMANNAEGMAAFSSRGPTAEGRLKPDIVAPGTAILSAHSRKAVDRGTFGISSDTDWMFDTGTSMATPLVAGCAAVVREALLKNPPADAPPFFPTAALVKALLINGAVELKGQYQPSEAGPSPNVSSGWGRVNVANAVNSIVIGSSPRPAGYHEGAPLNDEDVFEFQIPVAAAGSTLKVTLVWSDPPGPELQNDLDLIITAGGQERHGDTGSDKRSNVQQVSWSNIPEGDAQVKIQALSLTTSPQTFACAWSVL